MKHKIGSLTIEAIDTYVRVTVSGIGGDMANEIIRVTKKERPTSLMVAEVVRDIRGCWPDRAVLQACGRAADEAQLNHESNQVAL